MSRQHWQSILVAISDPYRDTQIALSKASAIALACGARVTLLNTFMLPRPPSTTADVTSEAILRNEIADRMKRLEHLARRLKGAGVPVSCVAEWDFPAHEAIVRHAMKLKPDLLVADSFRHGRIARWLLSNTDWELIRGCPCPIWFVKNRRLPPDPVVLVAVDPRHSHSKPSQLDDRLLQSARQLTRQLGGRINMGHAYELPTSYAPGILMEPVRVPLSPRRARLFEQKIKQLVDRLAVKHSVNRAQRFLKNDDPVHALPELVRQLKADILVMGAVARGRLQHAVIGSTAEKVIDQVGCDVFIVKPAGFKTSVRRQRPQLPV